VQTVAEAHGGHAVVGDGADFYLVLRSVSVRTDARARPAPPRRRGARAR
jgi:hypothetical protein